jgi:hypothetical protein
MAAPYNPKDDPNYTQTTAKRLPAAWEALSPLVHAFETSLPIERRQGVVSSASPQPLPYTQPTVPEVSSPPLFDPLMYGVFGAVPYYAYRSPFPGWKSSPRIPWWDLLPLTKHKRH